MATTSRTTDKNPKNPETPSITPLRKASCKSLEGRGKLDYELGTDESESLHWRISRNSGGGFFSDEWVSFAAIRSALEAWPVEKPMTSFVLRSLFKGKSANNASFLLATLLAEGVVVLIEGKRRQYTLGDIAGFLATAATAAHSSSGKASGKPKAKARSRMAKAPKATPQPK
jgi:hypothetical protein